MYNWGIVTIVFLITSLLNLYIGYIVFGGSFKENTKINYGVSDFGTMSSSALLFYIIATFWLLILIFKKDDLLTLFIQNSVLEEQLVNSGLLFAFGLVAVGYIIRGVYNLICFIFNKIGKKKDRVFLA